MPGPEPKDRACGRSRARPTPIPGAGDPRSDVAHGRVTDLLARSRGAGVTDRPASTLVCLAAALRRVKEFDEEVVVLRRAQRLHPYDFWTNYFLACALLHNSRPAEVDEEVLDEAIRYFTAAIALCRTTPVAFIHLGFALSVRGRFEEASFYLDKVLELDTKYANTYNVRAWLWATCPDPRYRDGAKAVDSALKACELTGWKDPGYLETLAAAYAERGDFETAVEWQAKALELLPKEDERLRAIYADNLRRYQDAQPYHLCQKVGPLSGGTNRRLGR